jgi:hypothetical protein
MTILCCHSRCQASAKKKVTAAFDGGGISSDGGVLLLAGADRRLGLVDTMAAIIPDQRDPTQITHTMSNQRCTPFLHPGRRFREAFPPKSGSSAIASHR